jgi:hypothetical protein
MGNKLDSRCDPRGALQIAALALLAAGVSCQQLQPAGPSAPTPTKVTRMYPGSRLLASPELTVEVMDPTAPDRYNTGVRFTPAAGVIRAAAGGREYLMHRAEHNPLTDCAGLFAEFDLVTSPPGFAEAAIGEPFLKIGVGALVKGAPVYNFYAQHKVVKLAATTVAWAEDSATFEQTADPVNGYAYALRAGVKVAGRTLSVEWTLRNTGQKPFETHHYAHNCFAIDNVNVKPGAVIAFPFDFDARGMNPREQTQAGREVRIVQEMTKPANIEVNYPADYSGPNAVSYYHAATGLRIDCETSVPGERVALHVAPVYVCPEQFVTIRLAPGETRTWIRTYRFGTM